MLCVFLTWILDTRIHISLQGPHCKKLGLKGESNSTLLRDLHVPIETILHSIFYSQGALLDELKAIIVFAKEDRRKKYREIRARRIFQFL
jgi:hypothetical protein